jgi:hypothetical protein
MKERSMTDALIREFLLGNVDDEVRQQIESAFLTDTQARERILAVEQDLIDDYLENTLPPAEKQLFLSQYAETVDQKRRLRITKTVKDWANRETDLIKKGVATSRWDRFRHILQFRPMFAISIAATLIIAMTIGVVWLTQRAKQQNRALALEQEVAGLNSPSSMRVAPPQMPILVLSPISVRGVEKETELAKPTGASLVELRLLWLQKENYPAYRAVLKRVGDDAALTIPDLHGETNGGTKIRLRLPAKVLTRGQYQIRVAGVDAAGVSGPEEEYTFNVGG